MDWKEVRERVAAAAADPGTKAVSDSESEDAMDGAVGGTGEEAFLGASGSSGAEWSRAEDDLTLNFIGQESTADIKRS